LAGLAPNCTAATNPQSTTITAGASSGVTFNVSCVTTKGSLTVSTTTTGADLDPDGYAVAVDGGAPQAITVNGTLTVAGLTAGAHTVTLSGLAANCTVSGANPQTVTVVAGSSVSVSLAVACVTTHGDLAVSSTTTGVELDPDGYTLTVDGNPATARSLGINATVAVTGLSAGTHTVALSGLAPNCSAAVNPQTANVIAGTSTGIAFNVSCATTTGALTVTTTTTGADPDPDGYAVSLDGGTPRALGTNASTTFGTLSAGPHTVTLSSLAPNCSTAPNPQTATVAAGSTTSVSFTVNCVTTHGDLTVTTATTGAELDPDGYTLTVDGDAASARAVASNGSVTFVGLAAGSHTVALSGLAPNCTTTSSKTITVVAGAVTTLGFSATCVSTHGDLKVTTATSGADLDADGYTLSVDGGATQAIGINGTLTFSALTQGSHTVTIAGLAPNCSAATNPQTTTVVAGTITSLAFTIACATTHGDLTVVAATTGADLDPDGYSISLDGGAGQQIAVNGSLSLPNLSAGSHTIALSGLAANCSVTGNPRTVTVTAGGTVSSKFDVSCVTTHGDLAVATTTTGADLDPDGYTATVDGDATSARAVVVNGSVTFAGLSAGTHTVSLSGLAANCTATTNPQSVTVVAGATTTLGFAVTCASTHGNLTVTTTTTGAELDPDGYTVSVDGAAGLAIGVNASLAFPGLTGGSHTVTLAGLAPNCAAAANPQTVSVPAGSGATLGFSITCRATTGSLTVATSTTGTTLDPDGYAVSVDGGAGQAITVNGSVTFAGLVPGTHSVALSGVASNCSVTGANPQSVGITAGATTSASFSVTCTASTYTFVGAGDVAGCAWTDDDSTAKVLDGVVAADPGATVWAAGDLEYDAATATEYANCYTPNWGRHKSRTYVALGNHEYNIDPGPTWDYFGDHAGPRDKGYYSINIGPYWHVIFLNDNFSYGGPDRAAGSPQDQWLQADLAANTRPCTIAIWHQPYVASDAWLSTSRKIFWDRLYAAGAEIVLNGHLHDYERQYPQNPDRVRDDARGIRQFVVGTGGGDTGLPSSLTPNTQVVSASHGVLKLTLGPGTYSWQFLRASGPAFTDSGTGTCH
ncbi:MAG: metallophosphoesterase, partial [Gemmatimonadaceae bacterium]